MASGTASREGKSLMRPLIKIFDDISSTKMKKLPLSVKTNQCWHLREAMEADGKLDVGNWAVQLLHNRPWW